MATFVHVDGLQGLNLDLVTHWAYSEKQLVSLRRPPESLESTSENRLTLCFAHGEPLTLTGKAADALHRYFCTFGMALS